MHHNFSAIAPPIFIAIYKEGESFQEQLNVLEIYLSSFLGFIDLQLILFFQIIREAPLAIFQFLLFLILLQLGSKPILGKVIDFYFNW
jgi:hypothetical protein